MRAAKLSNRFASVLLHQPNFLPNVSKIVGTKSTNFHHHHYHRPAATLFNQHIRLYSSKQGTQDDDSDTRPLIRREVRPEYAVLSTAHMKKLVDNDQVMLVDVREPHEVRAGRVPAKRYVHVPLGQITAFNGDPVTFKEKYGVEMPAKEDKDIVIMCRSGVRSTWALQALHTYGFNKSSHFPGAWLAWNESFPDDNIKQE